MRQTTRVGNRDSTVPGADAAPRAYDPPVTLDGGLPAPAPQHAPRPARTLYGWTWGSFWIFLLMSICANALTDSGALRMPQAFMVAYGLGTVLAYWTMPKPRQSFISWTLKVVGLFLNLYVGLVSVPESLRGLLPDAWAFGLPAFAFFLALYWMPPLTPNNRTSPPWHWFLVAAGFAAFWGWAGPGVIK